MSFKQFASFMALLALAIPSNALLAGFPYYMQSINTNATMDDGSDGATGNCWTAASNTDGAAVTLQKCQGLGSASQSWSFSAGAPAGVGTGGVGTIKIFGNKCLDVTNGVDASGTRLQIFGCATANKNQQWQVTTDDASVQHVQWVNSTRCVDLTGGSQANGTPLQIWTCQTGNTHQQWLGQYQAPAPPSEGSTLRFFNSLQQDTARQLSILAPTEADNTPVVMEFTDIDNLGQNWVYEGGSLKAYNGDQCLDVTNGNDVNGTPLQTFSCVPGNTNQQWTFNSNFSIQWTGHNKCIDLTNGALTFGTQLQIWTCATGNTNQKWRIGPVATS